METIIIDVNMLINEEKYIDKPIALAIGGFDGMHIGHQALFDKTLARAKEENIASGVFSFSFSLPKNMKEKNGYLMSIEDKKQYFLSQGFDYFIQIKFDDTLREMPALTFLKHLTTFLELRYLVVGSDFAFGYNRSGNVQLLENEQQQFHYHVDVLEEVVNKNHIISSTMIKQLLKNGEVLEANKLLPYPYSITAEVIHGAKRGRNLGFPTINMSGDTPYFVPGIGVYGTKVIIDGKKYLGITSVGYAPTVSDSLPLLIETNILDYSGDLYGQKLTVEFHFKIRGEQKFPSLDALIAQMKDDEQCARKFFQK